MQHLNYLISSHYLDVMRWSCHRLKVFEGENAQFFFFLLLFCDINTCFVWFKWNFSSNLKGGAFHFDHCFQIDDLVVDFYHVYVTGLSFIFLPIFVNISFSNTSNNNIGEFIKQKYFLREFEPKIFSDTTVRARDSKQIWSGKVSVSLFWTNNVKNIFLQFIWELINVDQLS